MQKTFPASMAYKKIGSGEPFKMGNSEKGKLWL